MKDEIFVLLNESNGIYYHFVFDMERRIKRIIFPFVVGEIEVNEEILKIKEDLNNLVQSEKERKAIQTEYVLKLELKNKLKIKNVKQIIKENMQLDKDAIRKIREIFASVIQYVNSLSEKKVELDNFWIEKIKKEAEESLNYLEEFQNTDYQQFKNINKLVIEKMDAPKR